MTNQNIEVEIDCRICAFGLRLNRIVKDFENYDLAHKQITEEAFRRSAIHAAQHGVVVQNSSPPPANPNTSEPPT